MLTAALKKKMLTRIAKGDPIYIAAAVAGVSKRSVARWLAKGRRDLDGIKEHARDGQEMPDPDPNSPEAVFAVEVEQALAKAESSLIDDVRRGGRTDWRASAFMLKSRFGWSDGRHGDSEAEDETGGNSGAINVLIVALQTLAAEKAGMVIDGTVQSGPPET